MGASESVSPMDSRYVIIFDGVCNFCNGSINFIIKRDPECKFAFTPMQSELAQQIMKEHGVSNVGFDTFLLIKGVRSYSFTDAALEIARDLSGFWPLLAVLRIIPRFIRDWFYRLFARNRYAIFGRTDACMVPTEELKSRFIGL